MNDKKRLMANFDSILKILGKAFIFCLILLLLALLFPFVVIALLFVVEHWFISILMIIAIQLILGTVSAWIEPPKSFYKSYNIKLAFFILFLFFANMGCLWLQCIPEFSPH